MMRDQARTSGSKRTTLARAVAGMGLIAAVTGAGLIAREGMPPAAVARKQPAFFGAWLIGTVTPRRVTLAPLSAARLGISAVAAAGTPEEPADVRIPLAALIYDPQGLPWAYAVIGPYAYERVAVTVDRMQGDYVLISAGLHAGLPVVDAGAPELLGVEYGVGEE